MGLATKLRNYFLTGIIVAAPIAITMYITLWVINLIDSLIKPLVPSIYNPESYLPFSIPGIGLLFAICGLTFLGALTANLFGRSVVSYGELILGRMPVIRNLYNALKQIFETILSQGNNNFQQAGLIEYPSSGTYAIVFLSTVVKGEIQERIKPGEELVCVFLPTTPNPTSGFLLFLPRRNVTILDMSVEDAAKMVISAGLIAPAYDTAAATGGEPTDAESALISGIVDGRDREGETGS